MRFGVLSVLVLYFGPEIIGLLGSLFKRHWIWIVAAIFAGICLWLVLRAIRPSKQIKQED